MAFLRHLPGESGRIAARRGAAGGSVHPTYALRPLLRRLRRIERPQVLDLGAAADVNLEFFTQRGCRVTVEDLADVLPRPTERRPSARVRRAGSRPAPTCLLEARCPEGERFDLALCWDLLDLLGVDAAAGLVQEIRSRLRSKGLVWAFFAASAEAAAVSPRRFRILGEESLEHRLRPGPAAARSVHQSRDILAMFDGFEVVCSTFLRVGMREMLFARAAASSA